MRISPVNLLLKKNKDSCGTINIKRSSFIIIIKVNNESLETINQLIKLSTSPYEFLSYRHVRALNNITLWISFNLSDAESEPQSIKIWISFSEVSKFLYRNIFRNVLLFSGTFGCLQESIALVVKIFERICWNFIDVASPSSIILPIFHVPPPLRLCRYPWNQRC